MRRSLVLTAVGLGLLVLSVPEPVQAQKFRHPRLHVALFELREAHRVIKTAAHDFKGHRVTALKAINASIGQVEAALRAAGDNVKGLDPGPAARRAYPNHPHIRHAIVVAEDARAYLQGAGNEFKGHRAAAIRDLNVAIDQLRICLKFAR
jgi:hypothetical protein